MTANATPSDYVSTHIAAKILDLSRSQICRMCDARIFKTAHKPGMGRNAHYKIARPEVLARKMNSHPKP